MAEPNFNSVSRCSVSLGTHYTETPGTFDPQGLKFVSKGKKDFSVVTFKTRAYSLGILVLIFKENTRREVIHPTSSLLLAFS